ncbi:hypothetical protein MCOR27_002226 [Pyricularia oryzae]|uniref:AB hydrolase-1 domain-containing protein n=1 Tax=Pyricularia grisea TaxID=148305 RepID=A0ABQ8NBR7_PYRGI|nr:hypothetical protein MCOR27_002226 [Pyricularia oryzae]KAI6294478.1 hypothetical protein MCOR33_008409 [Pyricularia grisea]KAI6310628.1 hypothetical protein MCOR29_008533 [Pyricularia oryzae]KAI6342245.1 hypothetical protein MCOR28_005531 [Pyricularia oryzae]KAI6371174.1 hypothetical protein MCOR32_006236 [Pyricularia oryzae]
MLVLRSCRLQSRASMAPSTKFASSIAAYSRQRGFASASGPIETVKLSYDLHEPAKPVAGKHTSPILVMHGLFGSRKNNRSISKALARDLGRGAKTAMTLALHSPSLIKDVIPVDNAPVDAVLGSDFAKYIRAMKEIDRAGVTRQAEADKILAPVEPSLPVRQFLLGNLHRPDPDSPVQRFRVPLDIIARNLNHMGDFPYKNPDEVRFDGRALFVRGTKSKYVADEALPLVGRFFPRFELADIDSGHWVISEKPEEFRQAVLRFLDPKE